MLLAFMLIASDYAYHRRQSNNDKRAKSKIANQSPSMNSE
jgi:hypothetical protein